MSSEATADAPAINRRPLISAGTLLGIGMGGFVDGIVLHQIAQWHQLGSAVLPPVTRDAMRRNMLWEACSTRACGP